MTYIDDAELLDRFARKMSTIEADVADPPPWVAPEARPAHVLPAGTFQSMFGATKYVVAGVIVALFGGLLLVGVLIQPSQESAPAAIGSASASPVSEPTSDATAAPQTSVNTDLLPGVDLEVEEVRPGVYRVLADGIRRYEKNVWDVAVSPSGDVFVEKHHDSYHPDENQGELVEAAWRPKNSRVMRLGEPGVSYDPPAPRGYTNVFRLSNRTDGTLLLDLHQAIYRDEEDGAGLVGGVRGFDGQSWVGWCQDDEQRVLTPDGSCWEADPYAEYGVRVYGRRTSGRKFISRRFDSAELGLGEGPEGGGQRITATADDTIWVANTMGLTFYDGERWNPVHGPVDHDPASRILDLDVDDEGVVWVSWLSRSSKAPPNRSEPDTFSGTQSVDRWDGVELTTYGPVDVSAAGVTHFADDGRIWFGGLTALEGDSWLQLDIPSLSTSQAPYISAAAYAPDGSIWLSIADRGASSDEACAGVAGHSDECADVTDGLYVITPEALAAAE